MSATPTIDLNLNSSSVFPGSTVPFTMTFSNSADPASTDPTGFGPYMAIDLGPSSNGLSLPAGALSTSIGVDVTPIKLTNYSSTPVAGGSPGGFIIPGTTAVVPAANGDTVYYVPMPFGSFAAGQTPVTVSGNIAVASNATVGATDTIRLAGGFQYGDIATGNTPITAITDPLGVSVADLSTSLINVVETQAGSPTLGAPNTLNWSVWADVALGATVNNLTLTDPLPPTAVPTSFVLSDGKGNEWTYTVSGGVITTITPASGNHAGAVEPAVTTKAAAASAGVPNVYYDAASNQIVASFGNYTGKSTSTGATDSLTAPSIQASFTLPSPVLGSASGNAQGTGDLTVTDELPYGATAQTFTVSGPNGTYNYSYSSGSGVQLVSKSAGAPNLTVETSGVGTTGTDWVYYDVADGKIISDFGTGLPAGSVGSINAAWQNGQPQPPGYETQNGSGLTAGSDHTEVDQLAGGQTFDTVTVTNASGQTNTYTFSNGKLMLPGADNIGIRIGDGTGSTAGTIWYDAANNRIEVDWGNASSSDVSSSKSWSINASNSGSTEINQNTSSSTTVTGVPGASAGYSSASGTVTVGGNAQSPTPAPTGSNAVTAELVSLSKGVTVTGGNHPGGELNWTITGNISNYADVSNIVVNDTMSSGQNYDAGVTPTLTVTEAGVSHTYSLANAPGDIEYTVGAQDAVTGETKIVYNVSQILADNGLASDLNGGSAPTDTSVAQNNVSFSIGYSSTIDTSYFGSNYTVSGAQKLVNQGDALGNDAAMTGTLVGSGTSVGASASAGDAIPTGAVSKDVYEIVRGGNIVYSVADPTKDTDGYDAHGNPMVQAGDVVTYDLKYTLPQTNTSNLTLTDYLPQPIYDVNNADGNGNALTFQAAPTNPEAAGVVTFGPGSTVPAGAELSTPVLTVNGTTDSFTLNLGAYNDGNSYPNSTVDVLVSAKVEDQPFVNGLDLTNEVTGVETSSLGTKTTTNAIAQVDLVQPVINVTKGVVGLTNAPANGSSASNGATEKLSGSLGTDFTAAGALVSGKVIDDANVSSLAKGASGAQAGDSINYVVAVQNSGGSASYNTVVKDTLPANIDPSSVTSVTATDGSGNAVSLLDPTTHAVLTAAQAASLLFTTGVDIGSITADNGAAVTSGGNIVLLNYTGTLNAATPEPNYTETNTAQVTYFEGVQGSGVNFATGVSPGTLTSSVNVTTANEAIKKVVTSTSETAALGASPTTAQVNALATDAANLKAGEEVTYTVTTTLDAGKYSDVKLSDVLPTAADGSKLTFVSASVTSVGSGIENGSAILASSLTNSGQNITDDLGAVTVDTNSLSGNNTITYTVTARVDAASGVLNTGVTDALNNTASVSAKATSGSSAVTKSSTANTSLVTPDLGLTKQVEDTSIAGTSFANSATVNAGDTVKYQLVLSDAAGSNSAFNVVLTDNIKSQIGAGVSIDASSLHVVNSSGAVVPSTATIDSNGVLTIDVSEIDAGQSYTVTYSGTVINVDAFNTAYTNTASVTADTLPSTDSFYATNNQTVTTSASATITSSVPYTTKALTSGADANIAAPNLAPGETGTFTATVHVPEGTSNYLTIADVMPSDLQLVTGSEGNFTVTSGSVTAAGSPVISDSSSGFTINFGNVTASTASSVTFTYQATVAADAALTNDQKLTNTITTTSDSDTPISKTADVNVVLPKLDIAKTDVAGAGNIETYTITVKPNAADNAPAYDVKVVDAVPTNEGIVVSSLASNESLSGGTTVHNVNVNGTLTDVYEGGTLTITYPTSLVGGAAVAATYNAVPVGTLAAATGITNEADLTYATQPTGGVTETGSDQVTYHTPGASLSGIVFTDFNDNGVSDSQSTTDTDVGLDKVKVELFKNGVDTGLFQITDGNGHYQFTGLDQVDAAHGYSVQVTAPTGYYFDTVTGTNANPALDSITNTTGATAKVATYAGEDTANQNSGLFQKGSLSGEVFLDHNDNGSEDSGDHAVSATVNLLNAAGTVVLTTTASVTGNDAVNYSFAGLVPGSYSVQVIPPAGDFISQVGTSTTELNSIADVNGYIKGIQVFSGQDTGGNNAGIILPAEVKGMVFFDGQCNSTYHVGDAGVAGVTVSLYDVTTGKVVDTAVTDKNGAYDFKPVSPNDTYKVEVTPVQGMDFSDNEVASTGTVAGNNVDSSGNSAVFSLTEGETDFVNAGVEFNGNFVNTNPVVLSAGQSYSGNQASGVVVVGPGGNNVHASSGGNNVIALDGNGNVIELGYGANVDIGTSCGSVNAQVQGASQGYLFAGGNGSSVLNGGTGLSYLMGGTGANQLFAGSGDNVLIGGGSGTTDYLGGASTEVIYQAGDGLLTLDNSFTVHDTLVIYGYPGGSLQLVNGQEELVLSATDIIKFNSSTVFTNGATTGGQGITFDANLLDAPKEELSFDANGRPVFSLTGLGTGLAAPTATTSGPSLPAPSVPSVPVVAPVPPVVPVAPVIAPPPPPAPTTPSGATVTETQQGAHVALGTGTSELDLIGYNNYVTEASGVNDSVLIKGDQGNSDFILGNGTNSLVLGGYGDKVELGSGFNTVSGTLGDLTLFTTGAANVSAAGYNNKITLGDGDSTVTGSQGNATIFVGNAGAHGGTITAGGWGNQITTLGGSWSVTAGAGGDTVSSGASSDTINLTDYSNVVTVSTGHDVVSGGMGQDTYAVTDFAAAGAATASLDITGFNVGGRDVLDVSGVLTKAGYTGTNLGSYMQIASVNGGADTEILVNNAGTWNVAADLHGVASSALSIGHSLVV